MSGETPQVTSTIARSLAEGWHYRPDWRNATVEAYLVGKQLQEPPLEALKGEEDGFVRQFYLFRRCGRCLEQSAFQWAYGCHINQATGAGSLIKALTVARVPVNEIAEKLRTPRKNIVVYQRLYFDIGRYLDEQAWLASVIFSPSQNPQDSVDPVEFRERHWMAAAFDRGERGLGQAFMPRVRLSPEEREELTSEIKSVLTSRAFEFVSALRTGLIPPCPEDFLRFTTMLDVAARQPVQDDNGNKLWAWLDKLYGAAEEAAKLPENADNIGLQETVGAIRMFRELDAGQAKGVQKVLSW